MASADEYVQYLIETLPNGENGANALSTVAHYHPLQNFTLHAGPVTDDRTDELRGTPDPVPPDITGWNATDGSAAARLYPNLIGLYFFMLLGPPVSTAGAASGVSDPDSTLVTVGATKHVWDSGVINPAIIRSAQVTRSYGNNTSVWLRDKGVTCSALALNIGDQGAPSTFEATLTGLYQTRVTSDPALTPTYDATTVKPFYRGQFSIGTWLTGSGSPINQSLSWDNPVEVAETLTTSSLWPADWQRPNTAGAVPRLTGSIDTRSIDPQDYDAFVGNTSFTFLQSWKSSQVIGASTTTYKLFVEGAATYTDFTPDAIEHKLRQGASIPWSAGKSGATPAFRVTLINGISTTGYSSVG